MDEKFLESALIAAEDTAGKTLINLYDDACLQDSGTAFCAIKSNHNERFLEVVCVTNAEDIERIKKKLNPQGKESAYNWEETNILQFMEPVFPSGKGFTFDALHDSDANIAALCLGGLGHETILKMEKLLGIKRLP